MQSQPESKKDRVGNGFTRRRAITAENQIEPSEFLLENLDILPRGRALDIAMGAGRHAVFLAQNGFEVEGVDNSAESVQAALALAARRQVKIKTSFADLEKDYRIRPAYYDLIIVFNYLQCNLFPDIKNGLKPGGMLVYETFTIDQPQFGHPKNPVFLLRYNELLDIFRDMRVLRYKEGIFHNKEAKASIVAQRV